jgi:hypothetical protein
LRTLAKVQLRPLQQASFSDCIGVRISGGQFASSHARASDRKLSISPIRRSQARRGRLRK